MLDGIGEINFGKQYRQGNRVYDSNAIAYNSDGKTEQKIEVRDDELSNAIMTVQKDSLVVENFLETANELTFVGGIKSNKWLDNGKNLSRNYKQGYRVYDSDGIACALTAQGTGGLGGYSGLYLVRENKY